MFKRLSVFAVVLLGTAFLAAGALAVDFPTKEIRIIIPYQAGGQSDLAARKIAEISQKKGIFPQTILVVNMSGANTIEGLRAVRDAKPDGYTLLLHHTTMLTMDALGTLPLKWRDDFAMVCQIMEIPFVFSVRKDKPWQSMTELIDDIKANSGKYIMSIPGTGGSAHFAGLQLLTAQGIAKNVRFLPLSGGNDSATALMGGRVDFRPAPSSDVARFYRSGEERVLAYMDSKPSDVYKEAQTSDQLGVKTPIKMRSGIFTAKKVPPEVIKIVADGMKKIVESDEFKEFMTAQAANGVFLSAEEWYPLFDADGKMIMDIAKSMK